MDTTQGPISFGIGFLVGFLVGLFLRGIFSNMSGRWFERITSKDGGRALLLLIISSIWVITVITEILNPAYKVSPLVHGLMGTVCGFFFLLKREETK